MWKFTVVKGEIRKGLQLIMPQNPDKKNAIINPGCFSQGSLPVWRKTERKKTLNASTNF